MSSHREQEVNIKQYLQGVLPVPDLDFQRLYAENSRLKDLLESTHDWLWEVNADGVFTYLSPQVYTLLGYYPEELIGKSPFSLMSKTEAERVKNMFYRYINKHESFYLLQNICLHKSGKKILMETSAKPWFDDNKVLQGYRGIDRDISRRQELSLLNTQYLDIIEQIAEPALVLDKATRITFINNAFCSVFGYMPEEVLGKPISMLSANTVGDHNDPRRVLSELKIHGIWKGEALRRKADGSFISVMISAKASFNNEGEIISYTGIYYDLTEVKNYALRLKSSLLGSITVLVNSIEKKDPYTAGHQNRVAEISVCIAKAMHKPEEFIEGLKLGAMIHDIGKVVVPAEILNKPGRLSEIEMALVREHSQAGYDIIKDIDFPWPVSEMILQHHERLDGSGYPNRLTAEQIIPEARILAVADVMESMMSHRPYRPALDPQVAIEELRRGRGKQFDAEVVDCCIKLFEKGQLKVA